MKLDMKISIAIAAAAVTALSLGAAASADTAKPHAAAVTVPAPTTKTLYGCVFNSRNPANRPLETVAWSAAQFQQLGGCGANTTAIAWNAAGPAGAKGATGDQGPQGVPGTPGTNGARGDTGATGPSGVQALATDALTPTSGIVTGGSFVSLSTEVGTASLDAGTYQLCVNGKAEQPTAATGSVSAQLFVYDQAKNADFNGDLLNVSADTQAGTHHDAYLNGCTLVSEDATVTLHIYGFGYDSDSGAGSWNLMSGAVTAIKLTPAS